MQRRKSDNSHYAAKRMLRRIAVSKVPEASVLDCFAGEGLLWSGIETARYVGIEKSKSKNIIPNTIRGDNLRVIPSLDLSGFNIFDLDSYGDPSPQLRCLARKKEQIRKGSIILYTFIFGPRNRISNQILTPRFEGVSRILETPALSCVLADALFGNLLTDLFGVRQTYEYAFRDGGLYKRYGFFIT